MLQAVIIALSLVLILSGGGLFFHKWKHDSAQAATAVLIIRIVSALLVAAGLLLPFVMWPKR